MVEVGFSGGSWHQGDDQLAALLSEESPEIMGVVGFVCDEAYARSRLVRAYEDRVIAVASNRRWSSDGLEIACWTGEAVRVAFAIDTHDREIIAWQACIGGISGQMVRDFMLACIERRFEALRAPHPVQWLADCKQAHAQDPEICQKINQLPRRSASEPHAGSYSEVYVDSYGENPADRFSLKFKFLDGTLQAGL